jgi:hypothetical protein
MGLLQRHLVLVACLFFSFFCALTAVCDLVCVPLSLVVTEIKKQEYISERLRGKHWFILVVTVVTVGLWATDQLTER